MTSQQAQSAVAISALVVAGVYGYRKLSETTTSGTVTAAPVSHFVIGFGFTFVSLSILAQAAPDLGGMLAILVAVGDALANGKSVFSDLSSGLKSTAAATGAGAGAKPTSASAPGLPSASAVNQATGA